MVAFDFLLVFFSDLRCRWNRCRVMSRESYQKRNLRQRQEQDSHRPQTPSPMLPSRKLLEAPEK